ncbi:MAG: hypothetical protein HYR84_06340 [Planctomycetes bacterium]|nr:hypothetical protein [Planctomycetota bacterium]
MSAETTKAAAPRHWGVRIATATCVLGALVWMAPIIAAWTPLVPWALARMNTHFDGTIHISSASLGWFSPVVLHGVELRDGSDRPFLHVFKVESHRSLLMLLWNRNDPGGFRLIRPTVEITAYENTSTLEHFLTRTLKRSNPSSSQNRDAAIVYPRLRIDIVDGTIQWHDFVLDQVWKLKSLQATIVVAGGESGAASAEIQAATHDGNEPGMLNATVRIERLGRADMKVAIQGQFTALPLGAINVLGRRQYPDFLVVGSVQGKGEITATFFDGAPRLDIAGEYLINRCVFAAADFPEGIYIDRIVAPCRLRLDGHTLVVDRASLQSELGTVKLQGRWDFASDWVAALAHSELDLSAEFNVAALAARCPPSIPLHEDLSMSGGQISVLCKAEYKDGASAFTLRARAADIRGFRGDAPVEWPEPIVLDCDLTDLHTGLPRVERLKCTAHFLRMTASQSEDALTLNAEADLQRLIEPLSQFLDLNGLKLAGQLKGTMQLRRIGASGFHVKADAEVKKARLDGVTQHPWRENTGAIKLDALGHFDGASWGQITSANATLVLSGDRLSVAWAEPMPDRTSGSWGTAMVTLDGDLARWQARVRPWTSALDDWHFAGSVHGKALVHLSPDSLEWVSGDLLAINLRCQGPNVHIQQPVLTVNTSGYWSFPAGAVEFTDTKLVSPGLQAEAARLSVDLARGELMGSAKVSADVGRLPPGTLETATRILGYALPTLAGAAQPRGTVSVTIERLRLPIPLDSSGELDGTILLKDAKFESNVMLRQLAERMSVPATPCVLRNGVVAFRLADGKVYHGNLEATWGDFVIRSSGAVGLDGSLAIVVETAMPERRFDAESNRRILIGGTLNRPHIDSRSSNSPAAQPAEPPRPRGGLGAPIVPDPR